MRTTFRPTVAALVLAAFGLAALTALAQVVEVPDPGLQAAVRTALNKPTSDITVADMESLTELDASWATRGPDAPLISSLEGLQTARNLNRLDVSGEERFFRPTILTSDFSPLAGLSDLRELYVG